MRIFHFNLVWSVSVVLLGATVLAGWYRHEPALIRVIPGFEGMPWSTALGFVLAGLALLAAGSQFHQQAVEETRHAARLHGFGKLLLAGCVTALILLGLSGLVEWIAGIPLGLSPDPIATGQWFADTNPYSGRMRPLAAVGFIAMGCGTYLLPRTTSPWALRLTPMATLLVMLVGLLGMVGPLTGLEVLSLSSVGPVFTAGVGFALSGLGSLFMQSRIPLYQEAWQRDDSRRISLIAAAIVVVTGMVGIIGGFGVLYPQTVKELENSLELSLKNRRDALEAGIRDAWRDSYYFANHPSLRAEFNRQLKHGRDNAEQRPGVQDVGGLYRDFGFSGTLIRDAFGREVARDGSFVADPEFKVAIHMPVPSELIWSSGFVLHVNVPMLENGKLVGTLEAERPLPVGNELQDLAHFGDTLDFPVCAEQGAKLQCFPFRSTGGKAMRDLPWTLHGETISVAYGLKGKSGIVSATDYRGVRVIAAYGPVGDLGLVANLEVDAAEFYEPIAQSVWPLFFMLVALATTSIVLLRLQLVPIVLRMTSEIDERIKAQRSLQESEARFAEITATLCEGVYVLDAQGAVTFVNPEAERILGWSAAELLGKMAHDVLHFRKPDGSPFPAEECPILRPLRTGRIHRSSDEWFVRKDGSFCQASVAASPIVRNGKVQGCVVSFEDITGQKRTEEELRKYRHHLEQLVEERTCELQKLNHELEAFSYSVSHDLRAPLRAINGYSGALREDFGEHLPEGAHQYLERVNSATIRMGELVDGLLNLSQVLRSELNFKEVNLSQMAVGIAASLKESEPKRSVVFSIQERVTAVVDPVLMRVLLENLFINAWKFTAKVPEGRVEFGWHEESSGVLCVRDNGSGFDMQFAHRLFQPFERLHKQGEFAGNGIGLATVRRIVERHQGRVWAESGIDQGTTIYFSLTAACS